MTKKTTPKTAKKPATATKVAQPKAKKTRVEKILDEVEASVDPALLEGLTEKAPGIWVPSESVKESESEPTQISTPAIETPVTESQNPQTEAEKEYGEKVLNELLADGEETFVGTLVSIEPAVAEAIFRRLTKGSHKIVVTKSTFVAKDNGVGPTKRVWEIAGEMKGAKRSEVLARCLAEGIGINTAKTQYQKFMEAGKGKFTSKKV